jgi:DNA-binding response OmpR family regulator
MSGNEQTILIADDNRMGRAALARNLRADGFSVLEAATETTARQFLETTDVDLLILDHDLSGADVLQLLRTIRHTDGARSRIDPDLPVLVLTTEEREFERLRCFELGCDDLVSRPYNYSELRARLQALLRRRLWGAPPLQIRVGPLQVDTVSRRAWIDEREIELSRKEFTLLRTLASSPSKVFSRGELMEAVWGWPPAGTPRVTRTLDSHASRLRRKLADAGGDFVVNVWGVGYKLTDLVVVPAAEREWRLARAA